MPIKSGDADAEAQYGRDRIHRSVIVSCESYRVAMTMFLGGVQVSHIRFTDSPDVMISC
jgi:hypothetical protein